ncbi:hypothetical protein TTHERM_00576980 (macronuclear) [Tetrahymena thermophila SB210]|uniref:Uncharacterized protein n=1 Tax=Tetrahymena thermophila (strain SB210) TaxID=312017 RepID=Q22V05_TETTS|nr:hypothetical protein TTHERM_00576980 [Tetrahymena thermophila SB210]EAR89143.2 hypothetical protein TTHERM_00576980 [Tetrahymena thermophila SB210]|eukprot:XP_001009388.2 hypothetical protein TTHERM_00576980 [Tetrahymena thermophila SB210]
MSTKQIIEVVGQLQNSQLLKNLDTIIEKSNDLKNLTIKISQTSEKGELYFQKNFLEQQELEQASQIYSLKKILETSSSLTGLEFEGQGQLANDFISELGKCIQSLNTIERLALSLKGEQVNTNILQYINEALRNKDKLKTLEIGYNCLNNYDDEEQMRQFAQFKENIQNSKFLSELKLKINDQSIPKQALEILIDVIASHQSIKKIEIGLNEELNVLFLDYNIYKPQNVQLKILNHKLIEKGLTLSPNNMSNIYLQNLTELFNRNYFFKNLEQLQIYFPKQSIIDQKESSLDQLSESIQRFEKLKILNLKIEENFCKNLTWVAYIFNNLSSMNCLEELILNINSNNTFNQLELNELMFKLQQLQNMKDLSIFIRNQKQNITCFFNLRNLPNLNRLNIENEEIQICHHKNATKLILKHGNSCQNSQIEQFINQNVDLKNLQLQSTNQNFLSMIYLNAITNNEIKYQFVNMIKISKSQSFLFYNLDITLTSEISENGINALCWGILNNIPKLENFKIAFQRELSFQEILYVTQIFQEKKEIRSIDLQFNIKDQSSHQVTQNMIQAISQNQALKEFKLMIEGASSFLFLTLVSKCKNLLTLYLNKNKIILEKQVNHQLQQQQVISLEIQLFQLLSAKETSVLANQLSQFKDLERLKIIAQNFKGNETDFIENISKLQNLKDLELKSTELEIDDFIFYSILSQHPFLTQDQLKVKSNFQINFQKIDSNLEFYIKDTIQNFNQNQNLKFLIQYFSNLKTLKLNIDSYNNTRDLVSSFSNCLISIKELNTLEIKTKYQIDQQTISTLLTQATHLNYLEYFQFQYLNNEGIDRGNIRNLNKLIKSLKQIKKFNLLITTNTEIFNFQLISNNKNEQNEKLMSLSCEISMSSRENQQNAYHVVEDDEDFSIFKDLNITYLNINFRQKSKSQIFDSLFSYNCFEGLVFLQDLSISTKEYSLDYEQFQKLTKNISSLQNLQKLQLNFLNLNCFGQQNVFEIGESIRKSKDHLQFIELQIQNQIEYQSIEDLIQNIQDASQLEVLSLNLNIQNINMEEQKSCFRNQNLKKLRSFTLQIEGQCQNMCQLIYQIISYCEQLSQLEISIGKNSGILQEDVNYINKAMLTISNLESLIIKIQQQEQLMDIFICNIQQQLQLQNLEIAIDQDNISYKTIRCLIQQLKKLKNIKEFKCFIDHPYSLGFLELIKQIQNVQISHLCKFKYQQFEIFQEDIRQIINLEEIEDILKRCPNKQLKCAIQSCQPGCRNIEEQENNNSVKELQVELISYKDKSKEYQIDGLTYAIKQFESLQHIHLILSQNFAINKYNGESIKDMFKKLTFLIEVKINTLKINQEGCEQIGQGLQYLQFMISFDIQIGDGNKIGDEGVKNLLQIFKSSSLLRSLSLIIGQDNSINEIGVLHICDVLANQKQQLTELVLDIKQNNNIGRGVKYLKDTLCKMQELQQLKLGLDINNVGFKNKYRILDSVIKLPQLKNLSINIIGLDKQKRKEFISNIKQFKILTYFEFQTQIFEKEQEESALLQKGIQNNSILKKIKYQFINLQYRILPIKLIEVDSRLQK